MRIGCTLPLEFVAGSLQFGSDDRWEEMYSSSQACLTVLKELGVDSIEIAISASSSVEHIRNAVHNILDMELGLTVHAWLPTQVDHSWLDLWIKPISQKACENGYDRAIVLIIHGNRALTSLSPAENTQRTVRNLQELSRILENEYGSVTFIPALELCRSRESGPVGTTFDEIYRITAHVGFEHTGICWDIGHSMSNYLQQRDRYMPSQEFVEQVVHTHVHGIGPNNRTHFHISADDVYVFQCVDMLQSAGYTGVLNLELYPGRWGEPPSQARKNIERSIRCLQ